MRGYELALERLLRERDRLTAREQPLEMLLLIESLQAAEKAAAELAQAYALLREHPLPPHPPADTISQEEWQLLLAGLDASPAAPVLFKGLVHTLEAAVKSLDATRSYAVCAAQFDEQFRRGSHLAPVLRVNPNGAATVAHVYPTGARPRLSSKQCTGCNQASLHLGKCAQCQAVAYCSRKCQVRHWKEGGHKAECAALAAQRAQGSGA